MRLFIALLSLTSIAIASANERVLLPKDYKETFVEYLSLDRTQNPDQFIRLFANDVAMQGKNETGELPNGSILVAEVYTVQKNTDGTIKNSMLNRRVKDKLVLLAVMEKREAFGKTPGSNIQTGNWDFAAYKPSMEVAAKNLDECRACHAPLTETDFLFSLEHISTQK